MLPETLVKNIHTLLVITLSLLMVYLYQEAWGWPAIDYFPLIEYIIDPQFLSHDFFVSTFEDFSARYYLAFGIAKLSLLLDIGYEYIIAYANILRIFILGVVTYLFYREVGSNRVAGILGLGISALTYFGLPYTAGFGMENMSLTQGSLSIVIAIVAMLMALRMHVLFLCLALAVSIFLHPVLGLHAVGVCGIIYIAQLTFKEHSGLLVRVLKSRGLYLGILVIVAAIGAHYLPFHYAVTDVASISTEQFLHILGYIRHPHHYIPSKFGLLPWGAFLFFLAAYVGLLYVLRNSHPKKVRIGIWLLGYLLMTRIVGYIFVEIVPTKLITSLMMYRNMIFFTIFFNALLILFIHTLAGENKYLEICLLLLPFILYSFFDSRTLPMLVFAGALCIVIVSELWWGGINCRKVSHINLVLRDSIHKLIQTSFLHRRYILIIFVFVNAGLLYSVEVKIPQISDPEENLFSYLATETPVDAVILAEYSIDSVVNQKIRLLSRRAVVVSEDFPFVEKYYIERMERYTQAYGGDLASQSGYVNNMTEEEIIALGEQYGVSHVVRTVPLDTSMYNRILGPTVLTGVGYSKIYIYRIQD